MSQPLAGPSSSLASDQRSASESPTESQFGEVLVSAACALDEAPATSAEPAAFQHARPAAPTKETSKHRHSKKSSLGKPPQSASGLLGFVRSQRFRKLVTMACLLAVAGLIAINVKNRRSNERPDSELEAIELTDFGSDFATGSNSTDGESARSAAPDSNTEPSQQTDSSIVPTGAWSDSAFAFDQGLDSKPRESRINRSGIQNSSSNGTRGAWLTGQIEPATGESVPANVSRSSTLQRTLQVSPVAGDSRWR